MAVTKATRGTQRFTQVHVPSVEDRYVLLATSICHNGVYRVLRRRSCVCLILRVIFCL
jgi:hypothetical protein